MVLELPDIEEHMDAREALRSIAGRILQWLAIFPGPAAPTPRNFYSFPFQGIARELEAVGREMMKINLLYNSGSGPRPSVSILNSHYLGWTVREWMRLSRWWLSRVSATRSMHSACRRGNMQYAD